MGNWNISIEGVGIHHNNNAGDVDKLAKEFVKNLEKHQTVTKATITYGGAESLKPYSKE